MADLPHAHDLDTAPDEGRSSSPWALWLTLAWILAVLMALAALALDLENLELALDFQRHLS